MDTTSVVFGYIPNQAFSTYRNVGVADLFAVVNQAPNLINDCPLLFCFFVAGNSPPNQPTDDRYYRDNSYYFEYPGSPWIGSGELSGMKANQGLFFLYYSFSALLGPKGFLLYNPFLIIALPYVIREIRNGRIFRQEALVISIVSLIIILYYLFIIGQDEKLRKPLRMLFQRH